MASDGARLVEMVEVDGFRYKPDQVPKGKKASAKPDAVTSKTTPSGVRRARKQTTRAGS